MRKSRGGALPREVFLSHSAKDRKLAKRLAEMLREHGVRVWYSQTNLLGAQQWHDEIGKALARCDWFLLVLSPAATRSKWVKRELLYALRNARYENRIIPVRYRDCDLDKLSWALEDFQAIDFTHEFRTGCKSLLQTWGIRFKVPH